MRRPVLSLLLSLLLGLGNVVAAETVKVKVRRANVRAEPKMDSRVIASVASGSTLEVVSREGDWFKVKLPEGIGYVFAALVEPVVAAAPAAPAAPLAPAPEAVPAQAGVAIDHKAVSCIVAERFPRMQACFSPTDRLSRARVQFRAGGTPHWYYVDMAREGECFSATLPKPKKQTKQIDYYVEAVDAAFSETRTPEHAPIVVGRQGECQDRVTAAMLSTASVVVGSVTGAPVLPVGFSTSGLIAAAPAGAATGASTGTAQGSGAGAAGTAAGGAATGMSLTTIGLIAGGAAAAIGVGVAVAGGKDPNPQEIDSDRDGFTPLAGDCNDGDPSINPNGAVSFENARFENPASTCPDGSNNGQVSLVVVVDGRNNRCSAVTINTLNVTLTVTAVTNVNNQVGQSFAFNNVTFSPATLAPGSRTTVRSDLMPTCTNPARNNAGFTELSARLTIATSAGEFSAETVNRNRTEFPFGQ